MKKWVVVLVQVEGCLEVVDWFAVLETCIRARSSTGKIVQVLKHDLEDT